MKKSKEGICMNHENISYTDIIRVLGGLKNE